MKITYICFIILFTCCAAAEHAKKAVKKPTLLKKGGSCNTVSPGYQAQCYRDHHQKVPQSALDLEKKFGPKKDKKPTLHLTPVKAKKHIVGGNCGTVSPAHQAQCYRDHHQKVPKEALEMEKKFKKDKKPALKLTATKKEKPHKKGGSCATVSPAYQADCYRKHGQKPTKIALDLEKKFKKDKKPTIKLAAKAKPHKVGGNCGTVSPAHQAQCYRDHHQKVPKEALELEKKFKKPTLHLTPVKAKPHKVGGNCGTVSPAHQAQCYRDHHQKVPKEALELEKKFKKPTLHLTPVKAKKHIVGGNCGTVSPAHQAQCYRDHHQKVPKHALELEKLLKKDKKPAVKLAATKKEKPHKKGGSCATVSPAYQADCYRKHGQKPTKIALDLEKKFKKDKKPTIKLAAKAKPHKVGGNCGTVSPAHQAQCYRDHHQKVPKEALELEKKFKGKKRLLTK